MFQIGDIVKDISAEYGDCNMIGMIISAAVILDKPVFHVSFFDDDSNIIPLYSHEIEKVS